MVTITSLTGVQLQGAMLTLRLAGHDDAANVFQAELTRRAEEAEEIRPLHQWRPVRRIKVRITGMGRPKTLSYQTAQNVVMGQEVEVPRWPGLPEGPPLRGTVVALSSDREGPLVTIIGG